MRRAYNEQTGYLTNHLIIDGIQLLTSHVTNLSIFFAEPSEMSSQRRKGNVTNYQDH
jgi:hypothetical protein